MIKTMTRKWLITCNKCGSFYECKEDQVEFCMENGGCFLCPSRDMTAKPIAFQWNGHEVEGYKRVIEVENYGQYDSDVYYLEYHDKKGIKRARIGEWVPILPKAIGSTEQLNEVEAEGHA